jgi:uncharacterized membrane protein YadS
MKLSHLKPSISKRWLIFIAGVFWSTVGILLCRLAYQWIDLSSRTSALWIGLVSIVFAILADYFIFSKIVTKNIHRLSNLPQEGCFFAFQTWKNYLNIIVMIGLGTLLRHSPLPKIYLSMVYAAIGGGLFKASFGYYRWLWMTDCI